MFQNGLFMFILHSINGISKTIGPAKKIEESFQHGSSMIFSYIFQEYFIHCLKLFKNPVDVSIFRSTMHRALQSKALLRPSFYHALGSFYWEVSRFWMAVSWGFPSL